MIRRTDRPAMTIAVDLGRKATNQTNKQKLAPPPLEKVGPPPPLKNVGPPLEP